MLSIIDYYNLIAKKLEEAHSLRFIPVNSREKDHTKKVREIKKAIRESRIQISRILAKKERI